MDINSANHLQIKVPRANFSCHRRTSSCDIWHPHYPLTSVPSCMQYNIFNNFIWDLVAAYWKVLRSYQDLFRRLHSTLWTRIYFRSSNSLQAGNHSFLWFSCWFKESVLLNRRDLRYCRIRLKGVTSISTFIPAIFVQYCEPTSIFDLASLQAGMCSFWWFLCRFKVVLQ